MSNHKGLMISVSGIRGIVGQSLTPDVVVGFCSAFASLIKGGTVVLGRDSRPTSPLIHSLVVSALNACGVNVVDLGICPTPMVGLMIKKVGAQGGIVITASHNPVEWNALKLMNGQGYFLSEAEGDSLLGLYQKGNFTYQKWNQIGTYSCSKTAEEDYLQELLRHLNVAAIEAKKFKVVLDSCNGAGSEITPRFLERLGCKTTLLNCDLTQIFPRNPEPLADHLKETSLFVKEQDCDICFVQDPDADRLAIIDSEGVFIGEEYSLVLAAQAVLAKGKTSLVTNLSSSRMLEDLAGKHGCTVSRSKVGEANVVAEMDRSGAMIGGEGNGGVIYRPYHSGRDSLIGMGLVLQLMAETGMTLSQLLEAYPKYVMVKNKWSIEGVSLENLYDQLEQCFSDAQVIKTDGLKFVWENRWLHVRASNTEPIVRLIIEAPDKNGCEELNKRAYEQVRGLGVCVE